MKDYYAILQVSPRAEQEVVEAAYRRLARKYHPDVYSGPDAASRMRELNEAYEVLGDPRRRAEYDAERRFARARAETKRPQGDRTPPPPPPPPPPHDEPKDSEGPTATKAKTAAARLTRRRPILIGVGLATTAILGSLAALGVWGWISATGDSDNTSPTVVSGSALSTAASQWLDQFFADLERTPFPTTMATPVPSLQESLGEIGPAQVWSGAFGRAVWDCAGPDEAQCIANEAAAAGAPRVAIDFFLEHGVFLGSVEEKGRVDWGGVWHPIINQSRGEPAFLNGTPSVLTVGEALGRVNDLASDVETYWGDFNVEGTPELKPIVWPEYSSLQSVTEAASAQTFVVAIPVSKGRAAPPERYLEVAFRFDGVGRYLGRGLSQ